MAKVVVDPGICGLRSTIAAESEDGQSCTVRIESECEAIQALAMEVMGLDGYEAAFKPFVENPVYLAAGRHYKHAACPVPSAIVKAVEVACNLALPKDVSFTLER